MFDINNYDFTRSTKKNTRDKKRAFSQTQKNEIWDQQNGRCALCHKKLKASTVEYDHGQAWSEGGKTSIDNGRALCPNCHREKHHKARLRKIENKKERIESIPSNGTYKSQMPFLPKPKPIFINKNTPSIEIFGKSINIFDNQYQTTKKKKK